MNRANKRVSVDFPEKVKAALVKVKKATRISLTGYVVIAVEQRLKKEGYLRK